MNGKMLPPLPKQNKKREAQWTTKTFRKWAEENVTLMGSAYEIKHTRGKDYFLFSELKEKQKQKLLKIRHGTFVWKNPDTGLETPPDVFVFHKAPAYVVIKYPKDWVMIDIDTYILEEKRSKRRSLLYNRAKELNARL